MNLIDSVDAQSLRNDIPDFRPGDTVNVHVKVIEGSKAVSYTHLTLPTNREV